MDCRQRAGGDDEEKRKFLALFGLIPTSSTGKVPQEFVSGAAGARKKVRKGTLAKGGKTFLASAGGDEHPTTFCYMSIKPKSGLPATDMKEGTLVALLEGNDCSLEFQVLQDITKASF